MTCVGVCACCVWISQGGCKSTLKESPGTLKRDLWTLKRDLLALQETYLHSLSRQGCPHTQVRRAHPRNAQGECVSVLGVCFARRPPKVPWNKKSPVTPKRNLLTCSGSVSRVCSNTCPLLSWLFGTDTTWRRPSVVKTISQWTSFETRYLLMRQCPSLPPSLHTSLPTSLRPSLPRSLFPSFLLSPPWPLSFPRCCCLLCVFVLGPRPRRLFRRPLKSGSGLASRACQVCDGDGV